MIIQEILLDGQIYLTNIRRAKIMKKSYNIQKIFDLKEKQKLYDELWDEYGDLVEEYLDLDKFFIELNKQDNTSNNQ
jgi:hypothetical protein